MEYQSFVCKLNRPHGQSAFAAEAAAAQEFAALSTDYVKSLMTHNLIAGQEGAGGDLLVLVSSNTLARLGVLDQVAPMVIGASMPKTEEGSKNLKALFSLGIAARVNESASGESPGSEQACEFVRTGSVFKKASSADPLAHSVIFLAMEQALYFSSHDERGSQEVGTERGYAAGLAAIKRLNQVIEGLAQQSEAPEVIGADDAPYELLDVKDFAERMQASDQTVYNQERAGRLISVLPPGRERGRRYPGFQLSPRLNRALHQDAIAMYRSQGQDTTLYWDFLRTRHEVFGGSTGVDFLLNRVANPALQDLEPDDLAGLFLETAEEDLHRAVS